MQLVTVDDTGHIPKNGRMTKEDRKRIGGRLRALRVEKGWDQIAVARKAKVAIGTLQSIEGAVREVRDSNIEKVAKVFGTSLRDLLQGPDAVAATDPMFAGLNREDLQIARAYQKATTPMRQLVHRLLRNDGEHERLSTLMMRVSQVSADMLPHVETLINDAIRVEPTPDKTVIRSSGSK